MMRAVFNSLALMALILPSACKNKEEEEPEAVPEPGELVVGMSRVRMPVPVGIGTVGYGGFGFDGIEPSPFAEIYPATTRIHAHPDFRAVAISRGPGFEVIFLRTDTVGVFQQFRRGVVLELEKRLGRNLDHALVIGATHTHAGPGRVIDAGGPFELIADKFHPEFYDNMVMAMADAVEEALTAARPGRVGWVRAQADEGIEDRRCEDGAEDYVNGTLPILAVEQDGQLAALVTSYSIHGTVLNIDDLTLSQDVFGGIEAAIEDRFDRPVHVQVHNAWAADVSPGNPDVGEQSGGEWHSGYDQMERVGLVVADAVEGALTNVAYEAEPDIVLETHRVPIDREQIGYPDDVFEKYEYGGVYCGATYEADCNVATVNMELDDVCVPFNADYPAPNQTEISVGRIGPMYLVTFPGEPGTALAEELIGSIRSYSGVEEVMFIGYGQDYLGYSIQEDDWWQGGYEASGAIWGPGQGDYLAGEVAASFAETFGFTSEVPEPPPIEPFASNEYTPYSGPTPVDFGTILTNVSADYAGADAVVRLTVAGADPWWGAPIAWLEGADGQPVHRPNGTPIHSDGLAFELELAVDPLYSDGIDVPSRSFQWTWQMPLVHVTPGVFDLPPGDYRIRVELPDGNGDTKDVTSGTFTWAG